MTELHTRPIELMSGGLLPAIAELAQLDQWVAWKYVQRGSKVDKPPVSPHSGKIENGNDPTTWGSYAQACACHRSCAGVGFAFHASDPYSGVDLDGCRDVSTGQIAPWGQRWIDALDSYTEISPSGTGVKIFVRGTLPGTLTHSMGAHIGIEGYSQQRYFTVTGQHLAGTPTAIRDAQAVLDLLWAEYHIETPAVSTQLGIPKSVTTVTPGRVSPGEAAAGRASLDELKARFRAENTLPSLLERYGAKQKGSSKDWSCPFCEHNHTYTLFINEGRLFSRSPNCRIPQKRGLDAFGLCVLIEHNNDVVAAAKKLNPVERSNPAPVRDLPTGNCPEYLTPAAGAKRQADRERARTHRRTCSDARMQQIAILAEKLAASKSRAFVRSLWAYHQHRWEEAGAPQHVDSNERIARSVLGLDRPPTANELRRLQLGHERLIAHGYLVRTIRYKKGEQHTNCWQPGDGYMVIVGAGETITMLDHESDSYSDSVACEGGRSFSPDRALLSYVRGLAKEVAEPDWALRDYAELAEAALLAEAARLEGLLELLASADPEPAANRGAADVRFCQVLASPPGQLADGAADSQVENLAELADGAEVRGPGEALAIVGGAAYVPKGAEAWYQAMQQAQICDVGDQVEPAELLDLTPEPEPLIRSAPTEPAAAREYWALKHKKPVNFKQASWIRHRLAALEIWVPASQALALEPPPTPAIATRQPRRRAAAPSKPEIISDSRAADQLQLDLPMGNSMGKSEIISGLSPGARAAEAIGAYRGPARRPPSQAPAGGSQ